MLIAGLAVIAVLTVAITTPSNDADPSSRAVGKLGTLAAYTWLQRLGLPVSRLGGTFDLTGVDVLVEYDPSVPFTAPEVDSVMQHVQRGGDVMIAVGPEGAAAAAPLLQRLGLLVSADRGPGNAVPAQPFDVAQRVHDVPTAGGFSLSGPVAFVPLLVQGSAVVAGAERVGGGRATVLGDTAPLSNDGLRHGDSAFFLLSVLERARGGRVAFDEFHHGEGAQASTGAAAIFNGPVGLAAVLAALVVVAFLALNGRRLGRPATAAAAAVPSAGAYVAAMGRLLARSRRRGAIAARYGDELKRAVQAVTGVDAHLDDTAFVAALRAAGHERSDDVDAVLARACGLSHGDPDERALLRLARDVDALERAGADVERRSAELRA
ncbi:MAG: hypothetical protein JOZ46_07425 [Candidatus Dormibacteraeota bacterium]|nr:hypothetical protein [Candidatus Dormibacteraeota bacterium]